MRTADRGNFARLPLLLVPRNRCGPKWFQFAKAALITLWATNRNAEYMKTHFEMRSMGTILTLHPNLQFGLQRYRLESAR